MPRISAKNWIVQSTRFEFIINLQAARAIGIDVPPETLLGRILRR
jgi:hypothetical protein